MSGLKTAWGGGGGGELLDVFVRVCLRVRVRLL